MGDAAVTCPFCASHNVRAGLPATTQYFEYRCRDCKRNWMVGAVHDDRVRERGQRLAENPQRRRVKE